MKKCSRCRKELPLSAFSVRTNRKIGLQPQCKVCDKARSIPSVTSSPSTKQCNTCVLVLPIASFYRRASSSDGTANRCKKCTVVYMRKHRELFKDVIKARRQAEFQRNKERYVRRHRDSHLTREYGICAEDFAKLHSDRDGCCDICRKQCQSGPAHPFGPKCDLHIDHCHETGTIRGLLCFKCNVGIGHLDDSQTLVSAALEYLKRHGLRAVKNDG